MSEETGDYTVVRSAPQPEPTGDGAVVMFRLLERLMQRAREGKEHYGTYLRQDNGRDTIRDLREELIDALLYLEILDAERNQEISMAASMCEMRGMLQVAAGTIEKLRDLVPRDGRPFPEPQREADLVLSMIADILKHGRITTGVVIREQ